LSSQPADPLPQSKDDRSASGPSARRNSQIEPWQRLCCRP